MDYIDFILTLEVWEEITETLGNQQLALKWASAPHTSLGGKTPREVMREGLEGLQKIRRLLKQTRGEQEDDN